jgi:subtilisin-like proprotein convertase family protein
MAWCHIGGAACAAGSYCEAQTPQVTAPLYAAGTTAAQQIGVCTNGTRYASTDVPVAVPDYVVSPGVGTSQLSVSGAPTTVSKLIVAVDIPHTCPRDLTIEIVPPSGPSIVLSDETGECPQESGNGYLNTVFDDAASSSVDDGSTPFTGSYQPHASLSSFTGNPNGTWTLRVTDNASEDTGTIDSWSITVW